MARPSPIDAATRAARMALRTVARDAVISVGSRYDFRPSTGEMAVVTTVYVRTEVAAPADVAELLAPLGDVGHLNESVTVRIAA